MQPTSREHLSPEAAQAFLDALPEKIKLGLLTYAAQIDFPVEAVIEMADSFAEPKAPLDSWTKMR